MISRMNDNPPSCGEIRRLRRRYQALCKKLGGFGSLSQGSVMHEPPGAWRWTRKVAGKTVSRGLSAQQAVLIKTAIANQRAMDEIIDEMRAITQKLIVEAGTPPTAGEGKTTPKSALS